MTKNSSVGIQKIKRLSCISAIFILLLGVCVYDGYAATTPQAAAATRPNIIVIMTDDQDDIGSMDAMPKTKALIGSEGLTFSNNFTDFSLCCPSRASFLTGQASHNTGILNNAGPDGGYQTFKPGENNSLPVWLRNAGYYTVHMGKWLNGYLEKDGYPPGWDTWYGYPDDSVMAGAGNGNNYYNYWIDRNGVKTTYHTAESDYRTYVQTNDAYNLIKSQAFGGKPLFMWLNPLAPHINYANGAAVPPNPAPRDLGAYNSKTINELIIPALPNFNEDDVSDKPAFMQALPKLTGYNYDWTIANIRRSRESLIAVDEMVAKVVQALSETAQLDNTYIVFTSDNGVSLGQHRRPTAKTIAYEEVIRVPLLIRGPGIAASQTRSQLVNNLDLVATIEDIANITPGRNPDGKSLRPLFQNASAPWRTGLLVQGIDDAEHPLGSMDPNGSLTPQQTGKSVSPGLSEPVVTSGSKGLTAGCTERYPEDRFQAIRTNRFKYIEHNGRCGEFETEFYDLGVDPYELESKPNAPEYTAVVRELATRLNTLKTCQGDSCWSTLPEPDPPVVDTTPIGHWKLDESSGATSFTDFSGKSGQGVCSSTGCPTSGVSGILGNALRFDGIDDQVKITGSRLKDLTTMTLSAWVNAKGEGGAGAGQGRILSKGDYSNGVGKRFLLQMAPNGTSVAFVASYTGGQGGWVTPVGSLSLNTWHHVVATYTHGNISNSPSIYIDGVLQSSSTLAVPSGSAVADDDVLYIGSRGSDNDKVFNGTIDQVRVYSRVLSAIEVSDLYKADTTNTINQPPQGYLDGIYGRGIASGWSLDPDVSSQSNAVHFYIDGPAGSGALVDQIATNVLRPDVNDYFNITGNHGFDFVIPDQYRDGKQHTIYAYGIDTQDSSSKVLLTGSPKSFNFSTETLCPMITGSAVRNCTNYVEWTPVSQPDAASCLSYCQSNNANACEWNVADHGCYVELGSGCTVQSGFPGWYASVASTSCASAPPPPAQDTTAPTVSIASPSNASTVKGTVSVQVTASDNVGVTSVSFQLDNSTPIIDTTAPYAVNWNTAKYKVGSHTVTATARDAAGNQKSATVTVKVSR